MFCCDVPAGWHGEAGAGAGGELRRREMLKNESRRLSFFPCRHLPSCVLLLVRTGGAHDCSVDCPSPSMPLLLYGPW